MSIGFTENLHAAGGYELLHYVDELRNVLLELFQCHTRDGESAAEAGILFQQMKQGFSCRDVAALSYASEDIVVGEVIVVVVVIAYVEEAVTFQTKRLMYLEIKTNCFHDGFGMMFLCWF